jgi:nucleoside phosphorylase
VELEEAWIRLLGSKSVNCENLQHLEQLSRVLRNSHYTVGTVCALHEELLAVRALFDSRHPNLDIAPQDTNTYALGRIDNYHVVAACLPYKNYGTNSATNVASHMIRSFPSVEFCLMVGIGGGVPSTKNDIQLGDVVVSTGVIQYDIGKAFQNTAFKRTGHIQRPHRSLMTAISELESDPMLSATPLQEYIKVIESMRPEYRRPGKEFDRLSTTSYVHDPSQNTCEHCDGPQIERNPRPWDHPKIHYGLIGSGNQVVRDAELRDSLEKDSEICCFEMEAAGIMDMVRCLVIRGVCDYADSHKNDTWQKYAAATAAAYTKLSLSRRGNPDVLSGTPTHSDTVQMIHLPKRAGSSSQPVTSSPSNKRRKL